MNDAQAEKKFYPVYAVFKVDVNDVKPFRILQEGCELIISLICNLCKDFFKQQTNG